MKQEIHKALLQKIKQLQTDGVWSDFAVPEFAVERPKDYTHGDYTSNLGFILAKTLGRSPAEISKNLASDLEIVGLESILAAGGYINFSITQDNRMQNVRKILQAGELYGRNSFYQDKKIMVEYTDPNPFKVFHVGHLMPNVIGESIATLLEFSGASVVRANYQGDVGRHVAMALWGMQKKNNEMPNDTATLEEKTHYLGVCYAFGNDAFESDETAKAEIIATNKSIYEQSDEQINALYEKGRTWSLDKFEEIYKVLGTTFDEYFYESQTWRKGKELVEANVPGIFEESDGAVIFDGEQYDLHKRVFINSAGLTTYEAKDLGLAFEKRSRRECDHYMIVTAVEQQPYFCVVFKAIELVESSFVGTLENIAHGLLQLKTGKMSSRAGDIISGEDVIAEAQAVATQKISEKTNEKVQADLIDIIAIAGIKFSILKQSIEKNTIYNHEEALSFEGDSGPYIQYTYVRTASVMQKVQNFTMEDPLIFDQQMHEIIYLLDLFPEIIHKATRERAPHYVANYLIELTRAFNSYYANNKILSDEEVSSSRVALTQAVGIVIKNGLHVLGIKTPKKM